MIFNRRRPIARCNRQWGDLKSSMSSHPHSNTACVLWIGKTTVCRIFSCQRSAGEASLRPDSLSALRSRGPLLPAPLARALALRSRLGVIVTAPNPRLAHSRRVSSRRSVREGSCASAHSPRATAAPCAPGSVKLSSPQLSGLSQIPCTPGRDGFAVDLRASADNLAFRPLARQPKLACVWLVHTTLWRSEGWWRIPGSNR